MKVNFVKSRKPKDIVLTRDLRKILACLKEGDRAAYQVDVMKECGLDTATFYRNLLTLTDHFHIFAYIGEKGTVLVDYQLDPMLATHRKLAKKFGIEL